MWRDKLVIGGALGFLAIAFIALSGSLSPSQQTLSPNTTTPTEIDVVSRECAAGDLAIAIEVRTPSVEQREDSGWDAVQSPHPVASLVARSVSDHRCVGALGAWDFKILDPVGKTIADWNNVGWFDVNYPPGRSRSFSLPAVFTCARPGPFTAVARFHGGAYTIRYGLKRSDITCT